jgi:hypothetical protein
VATSILKILNLLSSNPSGPGTAGIIVPQLTFAKITEDLPTLSDSLKTLKEPEQEPVSLVEFFSLSHLV